MKSDMLARWLLALTLAGTACAAAAQQLYRWTDATGRTHVTDTPPPAGARNVRRLGPGAGSEPTSEGPVPFVLQKATKDFPVTLYTAPSCQEPCARAREHLNKRGVPFREVQVWDEPGAAELKQLTGGLELPAFKVGASVFTGFQASAYDGLLDSAGYPKAGMLPPRAQAAPPVPEGYAPPEAPPTARPIEPEPEAPKGPYSPGAAPQRGRR